MILSRNLGGMGEWCTPVHPLLTETPITPAATSTDTPEVTPTQDLSTTSTETPTETWTPVAIETGTETPTSTFTPTETWTPAATETGTETPTPSLTPTETETPVLTFTPTFTSTFTDTATPSLTPSLTPTPVTPEATPTATQPPVYKAEYAYDGDGRGFCTPERREFCAPSRFLRVGSERGNLVKSVINGVTTYYPNSSYEKRVEGATEKIFKYYFAGSVRIAMRENGVITWILNDHLGSTTALAAEDGTLSALFRYTAFGELRAANGSDTAPMTDYQFTGQRKDSYINLYWYGSRWHDTSQARFIQPDTILPDPANPQSWNRYTYVLGNPIKYNDPSGHSPTGRCGAYGEDCGPSTAITHPSTAGSDGSILNGGQARQSTVNTNDDPIVEGTISSPSEASKNNTIVDQYIQGWKYVGTAWSLLNDPEPGFHWVISGAYIALWVGGHAALLTGIGGLACVAIGPGCVAAVEGMLGIGGTTAIGIGQTSKAIRPYYPPNQGFSSEATELILREGDIISRRGGSGGRFFSPPGYSVSQLSLPPSSVNLTENLFVVQKPFSVYEGTVAPWFGQVGGGIQYYSPIMNQAYLGKNLFILRLSQ